MANSGVAQRQSSQPNNAYHCKECSMFFDSMKSLDVHLHYHKENLLSKWASQATFAEESNNNGSHHKNGNSKHNGKGNATTPIAAPADSSDASVAMKKCPVMPQARAPYGRPPSPGAQFGYGVAAPTYQSGVGDAQRFSPANGHQMFGGYPNGSRATPPGFQPYNQSYGALRPADAQPQHNAFYDGNLQQYAPANSQDAFANAATTTASSVVPSAFRYHPYQHANGYPGGERVVSSSSYVGGVAAARPTSPQQCDKCGAICDTSASLAEHLAVAHPPTPVGQFAPASASRHNGFHPASHHVKQEPFDFAGDLDGRVKQETEDPPNEILDLDSHKVHVYQSPEEEEERNGGGGGGNPHSVSAMLWGGGGGQQPPPDDGKMYGGGGHSPVDRKPFAQHRGPPTPDYVTSTLTSPPSAPHLVPHGYHQNAPPPRYQTLDHRPQPMQPITSSQVPSLAPSLASPPPSAAPTPTPAASGKGNSWKSNEARRPKTYNCSACNKWFTSSGHLKRHYNTTLHKNAVKQSGVPDPATLPIQSHHHPDRDPNYVPRGRRGAAQEDVNERASPVSSLGNEDSSRSDEYSRSTPQQHAQLGGLMQNGGLVTQHPPQHPQHPPQHPQQHPQQRPSEYELHQQHQLPPPGYAMEHRPPAMMHHHLGQHRSPSPGRILGPDMMAPTADMMHADAMMRRLTPPHPVALLTSSQMEQQMMQPYPNALPPHVTSSNSSSIVSLLPPSTTTHHTTNSSQITSTGSPASSSASPPVDEAALARHQMEEMLHHQQQSAQIAQPQFYGNVFSPLPSFAQFGQQFGQPTSMALMQQHGMNGLMAPGSGYLVAPSTAENVGGLLPSPSSQYLLMETYQGAHHQHMQQQQHQQQQQQQQLQQQQQQQQQQLTQLTPMTPMAMSQHDDFVTGDLQVTSLAGDRFNNSDSNTSLGENILSPVGTPDCPTSTRSEYELMIDMKQDDEARLKEDILTVSSTNEINIYSSNSISNGTLHKCIDCDKVFNKACYLTQHNKSFHSGLKPFKCHRCGKRFPSEFLYEEHLTKHAGDKPYKCEICPKQFNHKTDLRRHLCLHTGEKPYSCEICGKGFIRKDHMLKHCITHRRKLLNQPSHITA